MNSSTLRSQTVTTNTSPHPNSNMQTILAPPPTHHPHQQQQDHNNTNHESDTYQPIKVYMYDDDNDNRDSEVFDMLAEHLDQVDWDNLCDLMEEDDSEQQEDVVDIMPLLLEEERVASPPTLLWSVQEEGEEPQQQGGGGCTNLPAPPSPVPSPRNGESIAAVTVSASSMEDSSATLVSTEDSAQPVTSMVSNSSSTTASSLSPTEKKSKKSKKQPTESKQLVRKSQVDCRHILSGRRYSTNQHCGNIEFRKIIQQHLERYQQSSKRNERAAIGKDIYTALTQQHQLIFVQCNDQTGWCRPLSQKEARQKIGHALRDAAASRERKFINQFTTVLKCSEQELFAPLPLE